MNQTAPLLGSGKASATFQKMSDPASPGGKAVKAIASSKSTKAAAITAGAAAATIGCAACPYTAAAAPLCGVVGGLTAGLIHDGIRSLDRSIKKRRKRIRKKLSDARAKQVELEAALDESLNDLVAAWSRLAPKEQRITKEQAGDLLSTGGVPIVWDILPGQENSDTCRAGIAPKAAWRTPFFESLMYDHPGLVRADVKCKWGDTSPTRKEIKRREATTDSAMALFELQLSSAFEKASAVLISIAAQRAAIRILMDDTERKRAEITASNAARVRIRNYTIFGSSVLVASGVVWLVLRRRT
jgi:hypothetical protein